MSSEERRVGLFDPGSKPDLVGCPLDRLTWTPTGLLQWTCHPATFWQLLSWNFDRFRFAAIRRASDDCKQETRTVCPRSKACCSGALCNIFGLVPRNQASPPMGGALIRCNGDPMRRTGRAPDRRSRRARRPQPCGSCAQKKWEAPAWAEASRRKGRCRVSAL